jgi:acetylornithine deacetylase/succinyl-diaminopimelate desuccinylase-like protein
MKLDSNTVQRLRGAINLERLVDTAVQLVEIPSPTRSASAVANRLAEILKRDGFPVERPEAGWPDAPAVVTRLTAEKGGRTLQFDGHLDTVHLPFVPPRVENGVLYGSGASDMKGGIAAMVEALRVLRETEALPGGSVLLTAHELHEIPWGDGSQVDGLIDEGCVGDGVLLPEYLCDRLPVLGRGMAIVEVAVTRAGEPMHEAAGGLEQPSVIAAGAELVRRFEQFDSELAGRSHPLAGRESLFVGQVHSGEIYNQAPVELHLSATRRWLPTTSVESVKQQLDQLFGEISDSRSVRVDGRFQMARDAFEIDEHHPVVAAFQTAHGAVSGRELPIGAKPFVDDGNAFVRQAGVPAITHGPAAKGAHTLYEEVPIAELERVALVYALTAVGFCPAN